jgi:hypothetical protein
MVRGQRVLPFLLAACIALGSAGCGLRYLGNSTTLFTTADQRLVVNAPAKLEGGRNVPGHIYCAEPSPDVAKAISESTNVSGALDAIVRSREAPAEGALKAAAAVSKARAEALAQLTNRLATIQLLRDSLYRACEAYANGALSEITYAVMLSRFDKVMVTLLTGELVAGNFGQSLAVLGTSASGLSHSAAIKAQQDANKAADSQQALDTARTDRDTKKTEATNAQKALDACRAATPGAACTEEQQTLNTRNTELATADSKLSTAMLNSLGDVSAAAASNASVVSALGVGALPAGHAVSAEANVTKTLDAMQKRYLENINADPLIVACLTALDRARPMESGASSSTYVAHGAELVALCKAEFTRVLRAQEDLLRTKLIDSQTELIQGCMGAFREKESADAKVKAAAVTLATFCDTKLVEILKNQAQLASNDKQLKEAQLELERLRREAAERAAADKAAAKPGAKPATPSSN